MSPEELATEEKGSDLWKFAVRICTLLQLVVVQVIHIKT